MSSRNLQMYMIQYLSILLFVRGLLLYTLMKRLGVHSSEQSSVCGWTMLLHSVLISSMENSYDPPTFLSNFGTHCLYMISETDSVTHFYTIIFDTLGSINFSGVLSKVWGGVFYVLKFAENNLHKNVMFSFFVARITKAFILCYV